eukprot:GGOE01018118.1.p1 GENE.GGOE01018118.1~~GGOE01018118.1.p1  ORF type:complete len:871 (+),score=298.52 GGOE01018118.1:38-2614(+)
MAQSPDAKKRKIQIQRAPSDFDIPMRSPRLPMLRKEVHKFGGSSVATPDSLRSVCKIVVDAYRKLKKDDQCPLAVVVSAMGKTTDNLIKCMELAVKRKDFSETLAFIKNVHTTNINALVPDASKEAATKKLEAMLEELQIVLNGIHCLKEASARTRARVLSFGERMSASIIAEIVKGEIPDADWCDARFLIKTDDNYLSATVDFEKTNAAARQYFSARSSTLFITTGFISSYGDGVEETTVLGRGGSDYTASILGAALASDLILIWTDVDGVFSADPRKVTDAIRVPAMSFQEAMELSFFGAKVIYAPTMGPAMMTNTPLLIKSTFLPDGEGTLITRDVVQDSKWMVRGITTISDVCVLVVEGCGMVGVAGVSGRLFTALNRANVSVILISQASSEHSICFAVTPGNAQTARAVLEAEFEMEIRRRMIDGINLKDDCSILAIVGDGMIASPGVLGRIASTLGKHMVNVISVAQGSSERNISLVIPKAMEKKALNCVHNVFFGNKITTFHLFIVGTGRIGSALLDLLASKAAELEKKHSLRVVVAGIINKDLQLFDIVDSIGLDSWQNRLQSQGEPASMDQFIRSILETDFGHSMLIDCSNGAGLASVYEALLRKGIHVISSNKTSLACPLKLYRQLMALSGSVASPTFLYGVALDPVLNVLPALQSLLVANQIRRIEINMSCALSCVFTSMGDGRKFSEAAVLAKDYGETNMKEDFSAADFRRRMALVCRAVGLMVEPAEIQLQSFVADTVHPAELFEALKAHDAPLEEQYKAAQAEGKTLRYIGLIDLERNVASGAVQALDAASPLARSAGLCLVVHTNSSYFGSPPQPIVMQSAPHAPAHVASALVRDLLGAVGSH